MVDFTYTLTFLTFSQVSVGYPMKPHRQIVQDFKTISAASVCVHACECRFVSTGSCNLNYQYMDFYDLICKKKYAVFCGFRRFSHLAYLRAVSDFECIKWQPFTPLSTNNHPKVKTSFQRLSLKLCKD